jgi:hypothetical protein
MSVSVVVGLLALGTFGAVRPKSQPTGVPKDGTITCFGDSWVRTLCHSHGPA